MQDLYPNLPGILSEFKDGGLVLRNDPNPPSTESILLLGTAIDGPIMEPVAVDPTTIELLFGKAVNANGTPNGSTLIKGFEEAYQAGARDIRVMRVTGDKAVAQAKAASTTFNNDKSHTEIIGPAAGNILTVLTLNQEVIETGSVQVKVAGVDLTVGQFTLNNGSVGTPATIDIHADVASAGSEVFVTYSYLDTSGGTVTVTENAHDNGATLDYYIVDGADTTVPLAYTPKSGTLRLYANGVEVNPAAYQVVTTTGSNLVVKPGFTQLNEILEVSYLYVETVVENPVLKLESIYAGYVYNELSVEVRNITNATGAPIGKEILITKPVSKKAQITEEPMSFSSLDFPTLGLLARAINSYPKNNVVKVSHASRFESISTSSLQVQPVTRFTLGEDKVKVTKQDLYEALGGTRDTAGFIIEPGAYQLLENYSVDMVVPLGVHADDELAGKYDNFAYQLALATAVMSHRNTTTMGIISVASPEETGLKAIDAYVKDLLTMPLDFFMRDRNGNEILDSSQSKIDLGRYISVLAGPDVIVASPRFGVYSANSPSTYAGMVSQMAVQSAPTNKQVPGVQGLRFTLSNSQLNDLTGARFVTFKTKRNGEIVAVTDAMTAAQPGSDYARLVTYRVAKEAVNQIREVADPYIGEPNEVAQRNAMSAAISKRLDSMREAGALTDYDFQIVATPEMQLLGQARIELTIVPPMELRQITVVVSLRPTL